MFTEKSSLPAIAHQRNPTATSHRSSTREYSESTMKRKKDKDLWTTLAPGKTFGRLPMSGPPQKTFLSVRRKAQQYEATTLLKRSKSHVERRNTLTEFRASTPLMAAGYFPYTGYRYFTHFDVLKDPNFTGYVDRN
eukprot:GEMP01084171.1.p1 GENE.GEMP01084171.1~~GEMP01084171.1.p1  ORF type:complete len:136 (+),score=29.31 GEMP01084171.1:107-514(+)